MPVATNHAHHGLQARSQRTETMATTARIQTPRRSRPKRQICRWNPSRQDRRLNCHTQDLTVAQQSMESPGKIHPRQSEIYELTAGYRSGWLEPRYSSTSRCRVGALKSQARRNALWRIAPCKQPNSGLTTLGLFTSILFIPRKRSFNPHFSCHAPAISALLSDRHPSETKLGSTFPGLLHAAELPITSPVLT